MSVKYFIHYSIQREQSKVSVLSSKKEHQIFKIVDLYKYFEINIQIKSKQ